MSSWISRLHMSGPVLLLHYTHKSKSFPHGMQYGNTFGTKGNDRGHPSLQPSISHHFPSKRCCGPECDLAVLFVCSEAQPSGNHNRSQNVMQESQGVTGSRCFVWVFEIVQRCSTFKASTRSTGLASVMPAQGTLRDTPTKYYLLRY